MNSKIFKRGERRTCCYGRVAEVEVIVLVVMASSTVAYGGRRRSWKSPVYYWFELAIAAGALVGAKEGAGTDGGHGEL